ncbi:hypothetical protein [Thiocystis violacea]|uniref:hypothetical protein n=1 Tax=Thiocystis violacea TaxID=13725 RepID=UPI001906606E|nr:hypothetical protein [Thiocystis violacea]
MTKLQLRHPRDEAPLREFEDQRLDRPNQGPEAADVVKQSFIAEVTKLELRDQKTLTRLLEDYGAAQDENLVIRARQALLAEVVVQVGAKDGPAAALMGVTPATYRRWKDDLQG